MKIIRTVEIDNLSEGLNWAKQWLATSGADSIYTEHPYYVFGIVKGKKIGVRIVPRDHKKENHYEVSTIKKKDYDTFRSEFMFHQVDEWYVLLARTHRTATLTSAWEYGTDVSFFILLPESLLHEELSIKAAKTVNIGYTHVQKRRWSAQGAKYSPFFQN